MKRNKKEKSHAKREKGIRKKKDTCDMKDVHQMFQKVDGGLQFDLPMFASHATLHMHNTIYTLHEQWGEQGESC